MSAGQIVGLSVCGSVMAVLVGFLIDTIVDGSEHALWPRGLRWFPLAWNAVKERLHRAALRVLWPEKLATYRSTRVLRLEELDRSWRLWADVGVKAVGSPTPRTSTLRPCAPAGTARSAPSGAASATGGETALRTAPRE